MAPRGFRILLAALQVAAAVPAAAQTPADLAGWWLAIDDTLPGLSGKTGEALEELVVVTPDGVAEDRLVRFRHPSVPDCAKAKPCSDAPVVRRARLGLAGGTLTLSEPAESPPVGLAPALSAAVLTGTPSWTVALASSNRLMTLRAGDITRILVKVDANRFQRLRAGLMTARLPAEKHWRCYLANATVGDAAFAPLRKGKHAAPKYLADYLRIASYRQSLAAMAARPTADDPDPARRALAGVAVEALLVERFKDVDVPRTAADARRYRAQGLFIDRRATGASPQEANIIAMAVNGGQAVTVAATGAEFAALVRVTTGDADAKRLLCRE
jgi:hypothetical protein